MTGLLGNEWMKFRKQTGYRVLLIVFAVAVLLVMPISKLLSELLGGLVGAHDTMEEQRAAYEKIAETYRESGNTEEAEYYFGLADACKFFADNKIEADSWRYQLHAEEYMSLCEAARLCGAVVNGMIPAQRLVGRTYLSNGIKYDLVPEEAIDENGQVTDAFDASRKKQELTALISKAEQSILNADAMAQVREKAELYGMRVEAAKQNVNELSRQAEEKPDDLSLAYNLEVAKQSLAAEEQLLLAYRWLVNWGDGCDSWQYRTVTEVLTPAVSFYSAKVVMPEEVYRERDSGGGSYATYLRSTEETAKAVDGAVSTVWYSLINDIPLSGTDGNASVRASLLSGFDMVCGWISLFLVVVAVLTVSSEYTSGTIRLLLIRPKKRSKIILSKYFCVALIAAGMVFASLILLTVMAAILNGAGDLFLPKLFGYGDKVTEMNGVLYLFVYTLLKLIGVLLSASFAFLLATLIRKSALPIILSFLGSSIASGIQSLTRFLQYSYSFHVLDFTILTNFDPASRLVTATDIVTSYDFSNYLCNRSVCLPASAAVTVLHVAILVLLAVVTFSKREVRS